LARVLSSRDGQDEEFLAHSALTVLAEKAVGEAELAVVLVVPAAVVGVCLVLPRGLGLAGASVRAESAGAAAEQASIAGVAPAAVEGSQRSREEVGQVLEELGVGADGQDGHGQGEVRNAHVVVVNSSPKNCVTGDANGCEVGIQSSADQHGNATRPASSSFDSGTRNYDRNATPTPTPTCSTSGARQTLRLFFWTTSLTTTTLERAHAGQRPKCLFKIGGRHPRWHQLARSSQRLSP